MLKVLGRHMGALTGLWGALSRDSKTEADRLSRSNRLTLHCLTAGHRRRSRHPDDSGTGTCTSPCGGDVAPNGE